MRGLETLSPEALSRARANLASGFTRHVTIALAACLLGLVLG